MTALTEFVNFERRGRVDVLTVNNPPNNVLSHGIRKGLKEGIVAASGDAAVSAIVITCAGRTFIAGGDTTEFVKPPQEPGLHEVLDLIEESSKPVVAAIHGTALLGGLEVILACHYRVGVQAARFGLPGVTMGLLPGAGGTQRLPRVVGVEQALQMLVSGDMIGAEEALRHGLLDAIVDGHLTAAGVAFAKQVVHEQRPLRKTRDREDKIGTARGNLEIFADFRQLVARQTRGFTAPEYCIKAVEAAVHLPFAQGLARERELFLELLHSSESNAQRYFFMAERQAGMILDVPADTPAWEIRKAAVIGAGSMGGGIANRMLHQRDREAEQLLIEGALPHEVDKVLCDFGFPMGPFAMGDLVGLDVGWRLRQGQGEQSVIADRLCELGRFGQKTGAGYYNYCSDRTATPDPEVEQLIVEVVTQRSITRRPISDEEILQRLLYPMVNEGARILEEQIAMRASDIDVIAVYGYGWPVYRGGPMFWADFAVGLTALRDRMLAYQQTLGGDHWQSAALLHQLADQGKTFTQYFPSLHIFKFLHGPVPAGLAGHGSDTAFLQWLTPRLRPRTPLQIPAVELEQYRRQFDAECGE
jgi:enoyl-CoA hydratase/carnithine racemase/3-hydroxyacyl-CoA dehydrogenase